MKKECINKEETRKQNFERQSKFWLKSGNRNTNVLNERRDFALKLRKDKLNDGIMMKRMKYFSKNKSSRIKKTALNIDKKFESEYQETVNFI